MKLAVALKRLSDFVDSIVIRVVFACLVGMIVTITLQIIFRVFFDALTWTEELSRYLLVWSSFLGATLAYKRGMHISVTFAVDIFPERVKRFIVCASIVLSGVFFVVSVIYGFRFILMQTFQVSPALQVPMKYVYTGIPFSFLVMGIHGLSAVFEQYMDVKTNAEKGVEA